MTSLYSSPTTCDPSTLLSSPSTSSLKSTSVTPNSNKKRRLSTPDSSATSFSLDRSSPGESSNGQRGAMDPERAARLAARAARNRISAQNSRDRKKQHVGQLEEEVNQLRHDKAELAQRVKTLEGLVYSLLSSQQSSCTSLPSSSSVPLSTATPSTELQADLPITSVASNSQSRAEGHIVPVAAPTTPTVSDSASSTLRTSGLAHDSSKAADHARLPAAGMEISAFSHRAQPIFDEESKEASSEIAATVNGSSTEKQVDHSITSQNCQGNEASEEQLTNGFDDVSGSQEALTSDDGSWMDNFLEDIADDQTDFSSNVQTPSAYSDHPTNTEGEWETKILDDGQITVDSHWKNMQRETLESSIDSWLDTPQSTNRQSWSFDVSSHISV